MTSSIFEDPKISRAYFRMAMPLVLSMVVTMIYSMADTFFVARTNDVNIVAGVSLGAPLFTLFMAIGNIMAQGGSTLMSRLLGAKDKEAIRHVSSFCFYMTVTVGIVLAVIMLIFRVPIVYLLGADPETFQHAYDYYVFMVIGAPSVMLSFIHSNLLRSEGLSRAAMIGTVSGTVLNIILDPIFISVLGLGAKGAAIASVIGLTFTDIVLFLIVLKKSTIISLNPKEALIPADHVRQIISVGIPAAIVNLMNALNVVFVNQFLLPYGDDKIAAMGIALRIASIIQLVISGLTFGGQPLFAYLYGAKDRKRLSELLRFCLIFISSITIALSTVVFFFSPVLMRFFMDNQAVIDNGSIMLRWRVVSMVFVAMIFLMTIIFQSFGKGLGPLILSLSRQGIIFLAVLFIAHLIAGYDGIIVSQAIADVITAAIAVFLFFKLARKEFSELSAQ